MSRFSRHRVYNLTNPEKSLMLLAPLSRDAGGYAKGEQKGTVKVKENRNVKPGPVTHHVVFKDKNDPDYSAWILTPRFGQFVELPQVVWLG